MTKRVRIKEILSNVKNFIHKEITLKGWVRTFRSNRFININDGSNLKGIQCVINYQSFDDSLLKEINTGASIKIQGNIIPSIGKGQEVEVEVKKIFILGRANPYFVKQTILQPKRHSLELLREQAHLRFRTNTFGAIFRIRHSLSYAIHKFFHERGFYYIHTPIITGSDTEGAGQLFRVTTMPFNSASLNDRSTVDFTKDFFGKETHLTVSGQLEAETAALALGTVYTFGPTFRAENSNTSRHLAEFWMIEPEMAFYDLHDNMDLAEIFVKFVIQFIIDNCIEDLEFLQERKLKEDERKPKHLRDEKPLLQKLSLILDNNFVRLSYTEAIDILLNSNFNKKNKFSFTLNKWGDELQSEHERYLVEKHFLSPVIVYDYPIKLKAFYMRANDDQKTVRAMDVLFPGIGEIIGGSQREERYDILSQKIKDYNIDKEELWWYLETRKFGTVEHSGFGLGFERLMMFVTGMSNIRDVIPFPRFPKNASF